jgi:hypothetical protein
VFSPLHGIKMLTPLVWSAVLTGGGVSSESVEAETRSREDEGDVGGEKKVEQGNDAKEEVTAAEERPKEVEGSDAPSDAPCDEDVAMQKEGKSTPVEKDVSTQNKEEVVLPQVSASATPPTPKATSASPPTKPRPAGGNWFDRLHNTGTSSSARRSVPGKATASSSRSIPRPAPVATRSGGSGSRATAPAPISGPVGYVSSRRQLQMRNPGTGKSGATGATAGTLSRSRAVDAMSSDGVPTSNAGRAGASASSLPRPGRRRAIPKEWLEERVIIGQGLVPRVDAEVKNREEAVSTGPSSPTNKPVQRSVTGLLEKSKGKEPVGGPSSKLANRSREASPREPVDTHFDVSEQPSTLEPVVDERRDSATTEASDAASQKSDATLVDEGMFPFSLSTIQDASKMELSVRLVGSITC